jgi:hypothetical protein
MQKMECECSVCSKVSPNLTNVTAQNTARGTVRRHPWVLTALTFSELGNVNSA